MKHRPSRENSNKTLSKLNIEQVNKDRPVNAFNAYESETSRMIKSKLMGSTVYIQDSIVYKNMKLSNMVETLSSFSNCLDDTKWLFEQSYKVIKEFLVETAKLYEQNAAKKMRIDSIAKQYVSLKRRFDLIDMGQIKRIVSSYMESTAKIPLNDSTQKFRRGSLNCSTGQLQIKQPLIEDTGMLKAKITQMEASQSQHAKLHKQMTQQILDMNDRERQLKAEIVQLKETLGLKYSSEISTIDKIKLILKKLKDSSSENELSRQLIDSLLMNLAAFQERLRQSMQDAAADQEEDQMKVKKQLLKTEINAVQLELNSLKDQKAIIEGYIGKLQQNFEHRKRLQTEGPCRDVKFPIEDTYQFLLLQASSIEKLLEQ